MSDRVGRKPVTNEPTTWTAGKAANYFNAFISCTGYTKVFGGSQIRLGMAYLPTSNDMKIVDTGSGTKSDPTTWSGGGFCAVSAGKHTFLVHFSVVCYDTIPHEMLF